MAYFWLGVAGMVYYRARLSNLFIRHQKIFACLSVLAFGGLIGMLYFKFFAVQPEGTLYHTSDRWAYWQSAVRMWLEKPWTGVGLGGFATAYPYFKAGAQMNTLFAHSFVLQLVVNEPLRNIAKFYPLTRAVDDFWSLVAENWPDVSAEELLSGRYHMIFRKMA